MNADTIQTDFLCPTTGFLAGVGLTFALSGNYFEYNISETPEDADALAIASDWRIAGEDIQAAMSEVEANLIDE